MMKPIYIKSAVAISPQNSFEKDRFLSEIQSSENGKLYVVEPDYRPFINPVAIRRMSRLIKMGISTGMKALQEANVATPDAIITGTGLGSMTDMEKFLKDMITLQEEALNPTFFIQSTYNSVNGWISLHTKATGYNQTHVHRGFSFEMAMMDAQLLLNETTKKKNVLVGGFDEMTDEYYLVKSKVGYWKATVPNSLDVITQNDTNGTIAGEGATFFVVSNEKDNATCTLREVKMIHNPSSEKLECCLNELLISHQLKTEDIDVVVTGMNGDSRYNSLYKSALNFFPDDVGIVSFKHLTGEYPTASGFAVWLAARLFNTQNIEDIITLRKGSKKRLENILIINHYILDTASVMLLSV